MFILFFTLLFFQNYAAFFINIRDKILFKFQEKFNIPTTYAVSHIYKSSSELHHQQWEYTY